MSCMILSFKYRSEKILTTYSPEPGSVSPCHEMDWKRGGGVCLVERAVTAVVRIVVGRTVLSGRPKNEGRGRGRVVVRSVT